MRTAGMGIRMAEKAIFAGGCFWCTEATLRKVPGVLNVISGYTGGPPATANYEDVCEGESGHVEAIEITFDPAQISYEILLESFWREIDPTDTGGQFADRGSQYETAIFYLNEAQKAAAEASRERCPRSHFTLPKTTIRTMLRKIRCIINSTARDRAANFFLKKCGVRESRRGLIFEPTPRWGAEPFHREKPFPAEPRRMTFQPPQVLRSLRHAGG